MGANKPKRVYAVMGWCALLVTGIGGILGVALYLCKTPLLSLYGVSVGVEGSLDAIAFNAATTQLLYVSLPYFLCGIMEVGSGVLRGLNRSMLSMIITIIGSCVLRAIWLMTVFPKYPTLDVVYVCYPITWILTSLALFSCAFIILSKILKHKG